MAGLFERVAGALAAGGADTVSFQDIDGGTR